MVWKVSRVVYGRTLKQTLKGNQRKATPNLNILEDVRNEMHEEVRIVDEERQAQKTRSEGEEEEEGGRGRMKEDGRKRRLSTLLHRNVPGIIGR